VGVFYQFLNIKHQNTNALILLRIKCIFSKVIYKLENKIRNKKGNGRTKPHTIKTNKPKMENTNII
jgi:hypothetical protein